jgi:hypothetical protein
LRQGFGGLYTRQKFDERRFARSDSFTRMKPGTNRGAMRGARGGPCDN